MTYAAEDTMPSIYVLHESKRQSIVSIFNWTEKARQHQLQLSELGLPSAVQVSIHPGEKLNAPALSAMFKQIIANNRAGGWRKLKGGG